MAEAGVSGGWSSREGCYYRFVTFSPPFERECEQSLSLAPCYLLYRSVGGLYSPPTSSQITYTKTILILKLVQ